MSGLVVVGDVHAGGDVPSGRYRRHLVMGVDFAQLERDCLNFMIMGDMVDGYSVLFQDDVIECTDYREIGPEPLLLTEGHNV